MSPQGKESHYIHGSEPDEQRRLSLLNSFLNQGSIRELGLAREQRVLDVGSGLGQFTRDIGRRLGAGAVVVGVERDSSQLGEARRLAQSAGEEQLCEFRQGNAERLPLNASEWGSFDLCHTRFVLEHVRHPEEVVRQMVLAVRPGGRIVLEDDDHDVLRLFPEPAGFRPMWKAYMRSYDRLGNDPYVGRRLVSLLAQCGAQPVRNTWIFFGACSGQEHFPMLVANLAGVIRGAREVIREHQLLCMSMFDRGLDELMEWGRRPDAAIWFSVCWAEGRRLTVPS